MQLFVSLVLLAASLQSIVRLSLLPRRWTVLLACFCALVPVAAQPWLAGVSQSKALAAFESMVYLQNWCTLLCVQEILAMMIGGSLMADVLLQRPRRRWKFLAFLPSLLLPAGILYLQMLCFNHFLSSSFAQITGGLASICLAVVLMLGEAARHLGTRESQMLRLFHFEWVLLFLAMFVPLAATVDFAFEPELLNGVDLRPLLLLSGIVLTSSVLLFFVKKILWHRYVQHHTDS